MSTTETGRLVPFGEIQSELEQDGTIFRPEYADFMSRAIARFAIEPLKKMYPNAYTFVRFLPAESPEGKPQMQLHAYIPMQPIGYDWNYLEGNKLRILEKCLYPLIGNSNDEPLIQAAIHPRPRFGKDRIEDVADVTCEINVGVGELYHNLCEHLKANRERA